MRKVFILSLILFLTSLSASFAQGWMDYVKEIRGDVVVINTYIDMGLQPNSLNNCILGDSINTVPAGRVYELQTGGWYPQTAGFTTPADRHVVISGADNTILVNSTNTMAPPIISGFTDGDGAHVGGITWGNDLTVKNISQIIGSPDGVGGWAFYGDGTSDAKVTFENCMMEHNWWVFVQSNGHAGNSFYFKNNYFVNMSGRPCRRNGGIYDNVNYNTDTMWVENNTHVMAQGSMYKFRNYPVKWIYINHNTFINCVGTVIETQGYQSSVIVTNNIFVNSNAQPFRPNMTEDLSEQDADGLPTGLIDVAVLPDSMEQLPRKFLVQSNVAYWDSRLQGLGAVANGMAINGFTTWVDQSVTMNDRTQGFFDDDATYPFLTEVGWFDKLPNFANADVLLTDQVDSCRSFVLSTVDTTSPAILTDWRVVNTNMPDDFVYSDWPIPIDLSYDDADLMAAGTDGLPLGDLNWFPDDKATFSANWSQYYNTLVDAWDSGNPVNSVRELGGVATQYKLTQNYPNPFNPTTTINFTIPEAGNVTLKVYDVTGREIATLVNGFKTAQSYEVQFDGANLSSGVYFYTLRGDNFTQTKKMILMK